MFLYKLNVVCCNGYFSLYAFLKSKLILSDVCLFFTSHLNVLKMPVSSIPMGCFPTESKSVAGVFKWILFTKQYLIQCSSEVPPIWKAVGWCLI